MIKIMTDENDDSQSTITNPGNGLPPKGIWWLIETLLPSVV